MQLIKAYRVIALLLLCVSTLLQAEEPFGRLFTSAEERKQLDKLRHAQAQIYANKQLSASKGGQSQLNAELKQQAIVASKQAAAGDIQLSGVITRNDGKQQVWINGKLFTARDDLNAEVENNKVVILKTDKQRAAKARLKVGQKWQPHGNKIIDVYSGKKTSDP